MFHKGEWKLEKMFTTQLTGLFKRIMEKEEFDLEDGARLLAQAAIGEGTIYVKGFHEMEGIVIDAIQGPEPLKYIQPLPSSLELHPVDRVLIITRLSNDEEAVALGEKLQEKGIPFVAISGEVSSEEKEITELADIHINTHLIRPLLPTLEGTRVGFPTLMVGSYIFTLLKFLINEMIEEYEE